MACSPERLKRINKLQSIKDMWFDKDSEVGKNIFKVAGEDPAYFKKFYEAEMHSDFHYGDVPSMAKLKKLERKVKKFGRQMGRRPGNFAKWFYLPENVLKNNPITKSFFDKLIISGNYYRGNMKEVTSGLDTIVSLLDTATKEANAVSRWGGTRSQAQKRLAKLNAEYQKLLETNPDQANKFYEENLKSLQGDSELAIMENLYELMIDPTTITKGNRAKNRKKYGTALVQAAELWHKDMAPKLWNIK